MTQPPDLTAGPHGDAGRRMPQLIQHLEQRIARLDARRRMHTDAAARDVELGTLAVAANNLRDAAVAQEVQRELQQVLDVLR